MGSGYSSLADNLTKFNELGLLGTLKLERLDEGHGIESALVANNAQYHHTYMQAKLQQHKTAKSKKTNTQDKVRAKI